MRRPTRDVAFYVAAAIAAAYVLNEWVFQWWDTHHDADPDKDANTPPTQSTPPSDIGVNPNAMTSSASLHSIAQDSPEEGASQSNASDTDTEPFVDVLSPPPTHTLSRRRSMRSHDLFAESHMSFSELGNLVAPQDEHH